MGNEVTVSSARSGRAEPRAPTATGIARAGVSACDFFYSAAPSAFLFSF